MSMQEGRDDQRQLAIRYLKGVGLIILVCGVGGVLMYWFDVADTKEHPLLVIVGTVLCLLGAWRMFRLAKRLQDGVH